MIDLLATFQGAIMKIQRRDMLKSVIVGGVGASLGSEPALSHPATSNVTQPESSSCNAGLWQPSRCFCVPPNQIGKHKDDIERKLLQIAAADTPTTIPAAFFQMARRYLGGFSPDGDLEVDTFAIFDSLSPRTRELLVCAVENFESLPVELRDRVFRSQITADTAVPVTAEAVAPYLVNEVQQRASRLLFDDDTCVVERAGFARLEDPDLEDEFGFPGYKPRICRLGNRLTGPQLLSNEIIDLTRADMQQVCVPEINDSTGNAVAMNCFIQRPPCPGWEVAGFCLHVTDVLPGEALLLEGYNFHHIDARVLFIDHSTGVTVREVDSHVCGNTRIPAEMLVGGERVAITGCHIRDRISFVVPEDMPVGIFEISLAIPNTVGPYDDAGEPLTDPYLPHPQDTLPIIRVVPSPTGTFEIATEEMRCTNETNPEWAGSDEVAISIFVTPLVKEGENLVPGEIRRPFGEEGIRFGNVDSNVVRDMSRVIFQEANPGGVVVTVMGFEVDSEEAYREDVRTFGAAYELAMESAWGKSTRVILDTTGTSVGSAFGGPVGGLIGGAIGEAITQSIYVGYALWAPADLIIEDIIALTGGELALLAAENLPAPPATEYVGPSGIRVRISPDSKAFEYRELREYSADDSNYWILFRYAGT